MFFNNNNNRIIAIILVLMIICTVFAGATVSASAVDLVLTPTVIACVGAVLCAAGFTFSNADEMSALVQKVWDYVPDSVRSLMVGYGQKYLDNLNSGKPFILTLSEPIVSALSSWFADEVVDNKVNVSYGGFNSSYTISDEFSDFWFFNNLYQNSIPTSFDSSQFHILGYVAGYPVYWKYIQVKDTSDNGFLLYCEGFKSLSLTSDSVPFAGGSGINFDPYIWLKAGYFPFGSFTMRAYKPDFSKGITFTFSSSSPFITLSYFVAATGEVNSSSKFTSDSVSVVSNYLLTNGAVTSSILTNDSDYAPTSTSNNALTKDTAVYVPNSVYQDGALSSEGVESMTTAGVRDTSGAETSSQTGLLSSILEWLKSILDAITSGFSSVLEWLKSMLNSLVSAISGVATAVLEGVKSLFYPEGFTWDSFISEVQSLAPTTNVDFRSYATEIEIPDVTMTTKYGTHTVVDNSPIRDNISTIRKYLGAFLTALLVIFNANMVMKFLGMTSFSITDSRVNHETVDNSYKAIDKKMGKKGGR